MKEELGKIIDEQKDEIISFGRDIFEHAELGFKEFRTKEKIIELLNKYSIPVEKEYFETGFQVTIGNGEGPHVGLLAELDAIPTMGHPYANPKDGNAAHACGHSTQQAIVLSALLALVKADFFSTHKGKLTVFFAPAEEFTDIAYRKSLIAQGKIKYLSGKENMIVNHVFDGVDCIIHMHGMGEYHGHRFSVNSSLAGFVYKHFTFVGKASHAAVFPYEGINALNEFALFQSAVGMLRETFKEEDLNRVHGIVINGGETVNSIPAKVEYEAYVRSFSNENLRKLSAQLTKTAKCCAQALNGDCIVEDIPGYLPFYPNRVLAEIAAKNMLKFTTEDQLLYNEKSIAAGDVGDLSCFVPMIQFGYTGFTGVIHGKNLLISNEELVYQETAKIAAYTIVDLFEDENNIKKIKQSFKPTLSLDEYINYLDSKNE